MSERKKIKRIYLLSVITIVPLLTFALTYLDLRAAHKTHRVYISDIKESILSARKDYLRDVINRTISDIEHERELCQKYMRLTGDASTQRDQTSRVCDEKMVRNLVMERIRNTRLKDQGYIWVNEILNYAGGDNYAIRRVHPNLPETEGMSLSTSIQDIKGNTPYLTELEGVKAEGEIYFDYWFKKYSSDLIEHKLTYAKLYKPWNWVIASGVYLDDIEQLVGNRTEQAELLIASQVRSVVILAIFAALVAMAMSQLFNRKIDSVIDSYEQEVDAKEEELQKDKQRLEEMVTERTKELSEAERHYHLLYDNAPISLWLEDFSAVKERLDLLRSEGVEDFAQYFNDHPEVVSECAELIQVLDVNQASVRLHGARSKYELLKSLPRTFTEESYRVFSKELIALAEGQDRFSSDAVIQTLAGEKLDVQVELFVEPFSKNWSRVYLCLINLGELLRLKRQLEQNRANLEDEVRARTEELSKAVNLMSGREVRMAELKQQIAKLESHLKDAGLSSPSSDKGPPGVS